MVNKALKISAICCWFICVISCGNDTVPKPKAMLRLEYPTPIYEVVNAELPFRFEKNKLSNKITSIKASDNNNTLGLEVNYPNLKATIFLTYKKIQDNLNSYLIDAQNITQTHTVKADGIIDNTFEKEEHKTYGRFYEVDGNAASPSQFYLTDSINHFITGSLYFYTKPNFDSILPAAEYIKNDIRHIMETIEWKN